MADDKTCGCGESYMEGMPLPDITFSTFVLSLSSQALMHLGEEPDPDSGETQFRPHLAKQTIDILAMLQAKTEKGLDPDEKKLLCGLLYNLRMQYVNKVK
ncbi:DUF1844 domain-containing protein [Desulfovibrio aminophilus]|nr:DUF1844 domain-containing protein [Desulfovibrio aminophilus]MCM0756840.1 DUF1844 domain-containing protein [Desulfovibrio aminophilus]